MRNFYRDLLAMPEELHILYQPFLSDDMSYVQKALIVCVYQTATIQAHSESAAQPLFSFPLYICTSFAESTSIIIIYKYLSKRGYIESY